MEGRYRWIRACEDLTLLDDDDDRADYYNQKILDGYDGTSFTDKDVMSYYYDEVGRDALKEQEEKERILKEAEELRERIREERRLAELEEERRREAEEMKEQQRKADLEASSENYSNILRDIERTLHSAP
jgi:predicted ribosome quality control (RQC) complex YloA/Tae2 family protein